MTIAFFSVPFLNHINDGEGSAVTSQVKTPLPLTWIVILSLGGIPVVQRGETEKQTIFVVNIASNCPSGLRYGWEGFSRHVGLSRLIDCAQQLLSNFWRVEQLRPY